MEDQTYQEAEESTSVSFEEVMLKRVTRDFTDSKDFLRDVHRRCVSAHAAYHNASTYEDLRKKNRFPMPVIQRLVDTFVAHNQDKLFYAGKPCTVIGVEDADERDAEAKQEMMKWQDYKDHIYQKISMFLRDAALYPVVVAQVDFVQETKREWVVESVPTPDPTLLTPEEQMAGFDPPQVLKDQWQKVEVPKYIGPRVKRVDPVNLFFTSAKEEMDDEEPIMIRSRHPKSYFRSKPYFFNHDKIKEISDDPMGENFDDEKRQMLGLQTSTGRAGKDHEYIEWQGMVDKAPLYAWLGSRQKIGPEQMADVQPGERVWCVCGVADGTEVVRLEEDPLQLGRPNVIVGTAMLEEGELIGNALALKALPEHMASQSVMGYLLENFKQSVNAMWGIDTSKLRKKKVIVNEAGGVIETNEDPNKVLKRIEQPGISKDIYVLLEFFNQLAKDSSGIQSSIEGKADTNVETLGEFNTLAAQSDLRMRDALKNFEITFIEPLYTMRNEINTNFLDAPYVFGIIGESAIEWRTIEPGQIRTNVDFMCESSTRETNRAVLGQQLLQLMEVAPQALAAGQAVRLDKIMMEWLETIGTMKQTTAMEFFPLIQMEEQQGVDLNPYFAQTAMAIQAMAAQPPQGPGGNGDSPQSRSEGEAQESAQAKGQTQVGRT